MKLSNADRTRLIGLFGSVFGQGEEPRFFFAPGRVNLIGEHIDYNGGFVLPAALEMGNLCIARPNGLGRIRLAAEDLPGTFVDVPIQDIPNRKGKSWGSYQLGVINEYIKLGAKVGGADMLFFSDLPFGAGLSSSASIEVATACAVSAMFAFPLPMREIALLCQRAENRFVGVNCGIMDQYACAVGKPGSAMLLNCATATSTYIPIDLSSCGCSIVIGNTNKKRSLADSKYNERRAECEEGLKRIRTKYGSVNNLCELSPEQVESAADIIADPVIYNRVYHAAAENARVALSAKLLREGDIAGFGKQMNLSHFSLRDLYEVTGKELDSMTDAARRANGCLGSRMTGAGFGGCTVSIVKTESIESFVETVSAAYTAAVGLIPAFYVSAVGGDAGELKR